MLAGSFIFFHFFNPHRPNLEVKFRVILRDIDIVRVSTMFSIFAYHGEQVTLDGVSYLILGGIYVTFDADPAYGFLILETFTTHPYPYTTTTPSGEYPTHIPTPLPLRLVSDLPMSLHYNRYRQNIPFIPLHYNYYGQNIPMLDKKTLLLLFVIFFIM